MMKTNYFAFLFPLVLLFGACGTVERNPARTEETAIISSEAAYVTIQATPSEQVAEGGTEETDGND